MPSLSFTPPSLSSASSLSGQQLCHLPILLCPSPAQLPRKAAYGNSRPGNHRAFCPSISNKRTSSSTLCGAGSGTQRGGCAHGAQPANSTVRCSAPVFTSSTAASVTATASASADSLEQLVAAVGGAVSWRPAADEASDAPRLPPPEEWHLHPALLSG